MKASGSGCPEPQSKFPKLTQALDWGGDLTVQKEVEVLELEHNGRYRGEDEAEYKANEC